MKSLVIASMLLIVCSDALWATTKQGKVRWRNDDGGETGATWRVMENMTDTLRSPSRIRLRLELYNTEMFGGPNRYLSLHYSTDATNYTRITSDTSNHWVIASSEHVTDQEATTDLLTNTLVHAAGGVVLDSTYTIYFTAVGPASNEFEFVLAPTANVTSGTTYYFQMRDTTGGVIDLVDNNGVLIYDVSPQLSSSGSVANVTYSSADLTGEVNALGESTWVYFEYGDYPSLGQQTSTESIGGDTSAVAVSHAISGLSPHKQYFFRLVAYSAIDTAIGPTRQFFADGPPVGGGKMLFLDGTTYGSSTRMVQDDMTIAMWIQTFGTGVGYQHYQLMHLVTSETGGAANDFGFGIDVDGKLAFGNGDGSSEYNASSSATVNSGQWVFVAATRELSTGDIKLYINGVLDGSTAGATTSSNSNAMLRIGWSDDGPLTPYVGSLDEVSIWNTVLTQTEIRALMHQKLLGSETGLVASWNFDEGSGTSAEDASSGSNDLTLNSNEVWAVSLAPTSPDGLFPQSFPESVGEVGARLTVTLTSALSDTNNIGIFAFGAPGDGFTATGEAFSGSVVERSMVGWGVHERGSDTVDLEFDYSQVTGIVDASKIQIMKREHAADTTWELVTPSGRNDIARTITVSGVTDFSEFALGAENGALPVQMVSLSAERLVQGVVLQWSTMTEVDNAGWEIERKESSRQYAVGSREQTAAGEWQIIGFVEGAGTSTSPKTYTFMDPNPFSILHFPFSISYRLNQIDRSGSSSYSEEVEVNGTSAPRVFFLSQNFPNPFNPTTTISYSLETDGHVVLRVYDAIGREVAKLVDGYQQAGVRYDVQFDASGLASGVYMTRLESGTRTTLRKMLLVK